MRLDPLHENNEIAGDTNQDISVTNTQTLMELWNLSSGIVYSIATER